MISFGNVASSALQSSTQEVDLTLGKFALTRAEMLAY